MSGAAVAPEPRGARGPSAGGVRWQCLSKKPWRSAVFLLFPGRKRAAGDPTGSRAELLSHRALVELPRGSSGVEQLPGAAGVTESERMQILY